jgi:hypothetical protein
VTPLEHIMGLMDPSYSEPVRRSMAQSILDKHAHELAEQQREGIDLAKHSGEATYPCEDCAVVRAAASIDPKAQRAATEGDTP